MATFMHDFRRKFHGSTSARPAVVTYPLNLGGAISPPKFWGVKFRTRSTTTRDRNLQFRGAVSTGGSPLDFFVLFLQYFSAQFSKTSPLKSGESSEKSSGENRVESCHVCGCHGFFGPEKCPKPLALQCVLGAAPQFWG